LVEAIGTKFFDW